MFVEMPAQATLTVLMPVTALSVLQALANTDAWKTELAFSD